MTHEQYMQALIARFFNTEDNKERDLIDRLLRHYERQQKKAS